MRLRPVVAIAATLLLTACGGAAAGPAPTTPGFPMTVENCGRQVTIDAPPQRVLALGGEAGSLLWAAGATERISTFAPVEGEPLGAAGTDLGARPQLPIPGSGEVSREVIIGEQPDLVVAFGLNDTTPEDLAAAGIPTLLLSGRCPGEAPLRGFDAMFADIATYGRVLGTEDVATAAVDDLRARVDAAAERVRSVGAGRSAAALFVSGADSPLGAYGNLSTAHQQLQLIGLDDVFGDTVDRYFEPTSEALIAAAPEVLVALYQASDSSEQSVRDALAARPELGSVPAVGAGAVLPIDYFYSGDGLLAVDGLERLAEQLATL